MNIDDIDEDEDKDTPSDAPSDAGSQAPESDYDVDEEYDNDYAENYFDNGENDDNDDLGGGGGGGGDEGGGGLYSSRLCLSIELIQFIFRRLRLSVHLDISVSILVRATNAHCNVQYTIPHLRSPLHCPTIFFCCTKTADRVGPAG